MTKAHPFAITTAYGFMPAIHHPDRTAEYLRIERFPCKTKATTEEATSYVQNVLWHRADRKAGK